MGVEHQVAVTTTTAAAAAAAASPRATTTPPPAAAPQEDNNCSVVQLLERLDTKIFALKREQWDVIAAMQKVGFSSPDRRIIRHNTKKKRLSSTVTPSSIRSRRISSLQHQADLGHRFKQIKKEEARLRRERHHLLLQLNHDDHDDDSGGRRRRSSSRLQSVGSDASTEAGGYGGSDLTSVSTPFWRFFTCHAQHIASIPEEASSEVAFFKKPADPSKPSGSQQVDGTERRVANSTHKPALACVNTPAEGFPLKMAVHRSCSVPDSGATMAGLTLAAPPSSPQPVAHVARRASLHMSMNAKAGPNDLSTETERATPPVPLKNRRFRSVFGFIIIGTRKPPVMPYFSPRPSTRRLRRPTPKDEIFRMTTKTASASSPAQSMKGRRSHSLAEMKSSSTAATPGGTADTPKVQPEAQPKVGWARIIKKTEERDSVARSKKGATDVSTGAPAADSLVPLGRSCDVEETHNPSASEGYGKPNKAFLARSQAAESIETYSTSDFSSRGSTEAEAREDPCMHNNQEILLEKAEMALPEAPGDTTATPSSSTVQQTPKAELVDQQAAQVAHAQGVPLGPSRLLPTGCSEGGISHESVSEAISLRVNTTTLEGCTLVSPVPSFGGRLESDTTASASGSESPLISANATQAKRAMSEITLPEASPISLVTQRVDLTYGLGFLRVDGTVGVLFKDKTRIYLEPDRLAFCYVEHSKASSSIIPEEEVGRERKTVEARSSRIRHRLDFYPFYLNKKVSALKHFRTFYRTSPEDSTTGTADQEMMTPSATRHASMRDKVKKGMTPPQVVAQHGSTGDFVEKGQRSKRGTGLFRVRDGMVEVLYQDGTEIVLPKSMRLVTFVDEAGERETMTIHNAQHRCGSSIVGIGKSNEAEGRI